ncbi:MAG: peptide-methionine (S)-S-oxide reductase MsrA [Ectothiorhodospiraceae bacterium]|nr:peptide-methionine (S)-S-oxide reductase MsrA [Ectothiorhodospiraceae bacterium]
MSAQQTATLGGGCFWCLEAVYQMVRGVEQVVSGYAGGARPNPSYEQVCSGATGHAEVVQLVFDPEQVSYRTLLEIFFTIHDPTQLNRQGHDVGTQYRSVIFHHDQEQAETAREVMDQVAVQGLWSGQLVTELKPLEAFYPAEDYHQNYFRNNPGQPYCQAVVSPKVVKARQKFKALFRG